MCAGAAGSCLPLSSGRIRGGVAGGCGVNTGGIGAGDESVTGAGVTFSGVAGLVSMFACLFSNYCTYNRYKISKVMKIVYI